jgi:hypothetical protein
VAVAFLTFALGVCQAQAQIVIQGRMNLVGTIESVRANAIVVKDGKGEVHKLLIQDRDQKAVALASGVRLRFPAEVRIRGEFAKESLKKGRRIRFQVKLNRIGKADGLVSEIWQDDGVAGIEVVEEAEKRGGYATCKVTGAVSRLTKDRLIVAIPPTSFTRKRSLAIRLAEDVKVKMESDDYRRAAAGAKVTRLIAAKFETGDVVVQELEVEITSDSSRPPSAADQLAAKYAHLSDEPKRPREIKSRRFIFRTDISDRQAQILLDKLETMSTLLSAYFGRQPRGVTQGFIVRDLSQWPPGSLAEPQGVAKIREKAGICFSTSLGSQAQSIIYACDDPGVVQHEATHAFCHLAFGSTGPTWLAEGVAEMGQYWKADRKSVDVSPSVLQYLQSAEPKKQLLEIAIPGRVPSGGWRDYAWRWALCHLLANNPNYANRFKPLAMALMSGREDVSFASVYGPVAKEISFEYDLFLQTLDNGYRADLCAWQWNRKSKPLTSGRTKTVIQSGYGWQASGVRVVAGQSYDVAATGEWKIAQDGDVCDADGDKQGRGRLVGVVFSDFKLSAPFELGKRASFQAPVSGALFLRCRDDWNSLEDNSGELTVHLRREPKE